MGIVGRKSGGYLSGYYAREGGYDEAEREWAFWAAPHFIPVCKKAVRAMRERESGGSGESADGESEWEIRDIGESRVAGVWYCFCRGVADLMSNVIRSGEVRRRLQPVVVVVWYRKRRRGARSTKLMGFASVVVFVEFQFFFIQICFTGVIWDGEEQVLNW